MKELIESYIEGKIDAISVIRQITGVFNPNYAIHILSLVCSITRVEQGDLDKETFRSIWLQESEK